jgi:hypothetical protein
MSMTNGKAENSATAPADALDIAAMWDSPALSDGLTSSVMLFVALGQPRDYLVPQGG